MCGLFMRVCIYLCMYVFVCMYVYMSFCALHVMYVHTQIHRYKDIHIHTYIHTHLHTRTHGDIYTNTHTHTHTYTLWHASFALRMIWSANLYVCVLFHIASPFALRHVHLHSNATARSNYIGKLRHVHLQGIATACSVTWQRYGTFTYLIRNCLLPKSRRPQFLPNHCICMYVRIYVCMYVHRFTCQKSLPITTESVVMHVCKFVCVCTEFQ
jgi:hypothetical protein